MRLARLHALVEPALEAPLEQEREAELARRPALAVGVGGCRLGDGLGDYLDAGRLGLGLLARGVGARQGEGNGLEPLG